MTGFLNTPDDWPGGPIAVGYLFGDKTPIRQASDSFLLEMCEGMLHELIRRENVPRDKLLEAKKLVEKLRQDWDPSNDRKGLWT